MSIAWMLVIAGLSFAEKVLPSGERLSRGFAVAFVVLGTWVATLPASVPGLTQPRSGQAMRTMGMYGMPKPVGVRKTRNPASELTGSMKTKEGSSCIAALVWR